MLTIKDQLKWINNYSASESPLKLAGCGVTYWSCEQLSWPALWVLFSALQIKIKYPFVPSLWASMFKIIPSLSVKSNSQALLVLSRGLSSPYFHPAHPFWCCHRPMVSWTLTRTAISLLVSLALVHFSLLVTASHACDSHLPPNQAPLSPKRAETNTLTPSPLQN